MNNKNSISKNRPSYIQQKFKSFVKPLIHENIQNIRNIQNIQQKKESFSLIRRQVPASRRESH